MKIRKLYIGSNLWLLCSLLSIFLTSCTEKAAPELTEHHDSLCLSVTSIGNLSDATRTMYTGMDRVMDLEKACTGVFSGPATGTKEPSNASQCIRISGSYQKNGETKLEPNLFYKNELIFDKGVNTYSTQWNYAGKEKEWVTGAVYQFRAYYPGKSEDIEGLPGLIQIAGEDATQIVLKYWTQNLQEDMLIASASSGSPVALDFHHALAAVRFQFKFADDVEDEDQLTSCRIENHANHEQLIRRTGCFGHIGSLVYGNGDILATAEQREAQLWNINWCEKSSYEWSVNNPKNGIRFSNKGEKLTATAYIPAGKGTNNNINKGKQFIGNDGWIYVIPQTVTKGLDLCFTTRNNTVREFKAPLGGTPENPLIFEAGNRYVFTLVFTQTELQLNLDILDWEEVEDLWDINL